MSGPEPTASTFPVAVVMECLALRNRWAAEQWEAKGIVRDTAPAGTASRVIVSRDGLRQVLFPGLRIRLERHEAEGYYLNITSPQPKVFVLWRMREAVARPELLTVSYNEGTRWADSGEQVDGVALSGEVLEWVARYVEAHYRPEPPERKRYASNRDHGRMGRTES